MVKCGVNPGTPVPLSLKVTRDEELVVFEKGTDALDVRTGPAVVELFEGASDEVDPG